MRLKSIDLIRGISVLGILVMNISYHNNLLTGYVHFDESLLSDEIFNFVQSLFADGKFRTLFCLMFGAGMAIQYDWCQRHQANHKDFLKSRMHWLLLFGVIHVTFIFGGDILVLYSICGLMLVSRLPLEQDILLQKGKKHFVIGSVIFLLLFALVVAAELESDSLLRSSPEFLEMVSDWRESYANQILNQISFLIIVLIGAFILLVWQPLGLMLVGVYLYRSGFFRHRFSQPTFRKLLILAILTTSISSSPAFFSESIDPMYIMLLSSVSAIFVALIYAHLIIKISEHRSWLVDAPSACGKLAFTLYLSQSIIMALLFRAIVPAIYPDFDSTVTMADFMLITVVFTVIQLFFAKWYVENISHRGPFESLWRRFYMKSYEKKKMKSLS